MSWVEQIRMSYAYNQWANEKVLDAAAGLSDEQLIRERVSSKGSIANDLSHVAGTQVGWLGVLVGEEWPGEWKLPDTGIAAYLREHYDTSHARLHQYIDNLTEEELLRQIKIERRGKEWEFLPWRVLLHLANHGTQHRGEVGIALLEQDASPGDIDMLFFYDEI